MANPKKKLTRKQMHHDPLLEKVTAVTDFAQEHSKRISYVIGGIALLAIIIWAVVSYRQNRNAESIDKLVTIEQVFFSGDYKEAIRRLEKYCADYEGTLGGGIGTYYLATAYYNTDQFDFAKSNYEIYANDYGDNEIYKISSLSGIAACYEGLNSYDMAIEQWEKVINQYPDFYLAPEYMLNQARCYKLINQPDKAKTVYQKITKDYPESNYARDAKIALEELG
jgi:tetratricopeptide (TPR) repeat protein